MPAQTAATPYSSLLYLFQVLASVASTPVVLLDIDSALVEAAVKGIAADLEKLVSKKRMEEATATAALGRITGSSDYASLKDCDLIIEVVSERMEIKDKVLKSIDAVAKDGAIIASNTSSISITKLAAVCPGRAKQFVGMHFFNPVPAMKLVEIIKGLETADEAADAVFVLAEKMGKVSLASSRAAV